MFGYSLVPRPHSLGTRLVWLLANLNLCTLVHVLQNCKICSGRNTFIAIGGKKTCMQLVKAYIYIYIYHDEALLQKRRQVVYHAYTPAFSTPRMLTTGEYIAESAIYSPVMSPLANGNASLQRVYCRVSYILTCGHKA